MPIRSILVPVTSEEQGPAAIEAGFFLAKSFNAHVEGLHVRPDPGAAVPYVSEGMSGDMIQQICDATERESKARAAKAEALFESVRVKSGIATASTPGEAPSAAWRERQGHEAAIIAARSRVADVTVVNQPIDGIAEDFIAILEGILFQSGRPAIVTPKTFAGAMGSRIAVAWNGSSQASRAVANAVPLLRKAKEVFILQAGEYQDGVPSAEDAAQYLAWHGVKAKPTPVVPESETIAASLLTRAIASGADLLVMGGYTHSRWREMILGGVTRYMLETATIPLFMAH